jgi:GntP family gluconate:H+ symporter
LDYPGKPSTTINFNIHPVLSLLTAAIIMGFTAGLDGTFIITKIADGFGNSLKSIGIIIAFGTVLLVYTLNRAAMQVLWQPLC